MEIILLKHVINNKVDVYHGYQLRSAIARTLEPQVRTKHFANFPKTVDCYAQLIFCFQSLEV